MTERRRRSIDRPVPMNAIDSIDTIWRVSGLDDVMESVISEVEGALGCAVADLRSGALL